MNERPYVHLRKDLREPVEAPVWPAGIRCASFDAERHVKQAHDLLLDAYRAGGGHVGLREGWWAAVREDPEYEPSTFLLALAGDNQVIGLAQCWTSGFLKDLAVFEPWRRMGVGKALLLQVFASFQARGAQHLDLKVEHDNPSGAERLYRRIGMTPVV